MNLDIARRHGQFGAKVAVMSRNQERVDAAVASLQADGIEAMGFSADARDFDRVAETMTQTAAAFGGLDLVVAGQAGNFYAPVLGMSTNSFEAIIDWWVPSTSSRPAIPIFAAPGPA